MVDTRTVDKVMSLEADLARLRELTKVMRYIALMTERA